MPKVTRRQVLQGGVAASLLATVVPLMSGCASLGFDDESFLKVPLSEYDFRKHSLSNSFELYFNPTGTFVATSGTLEIATERNYEVNSRNHLLANVLGRGTKSYHSLEEIEMRLKELYASVAAPNIYSMTQNSFINFSFSSITNPVQEEDQLARTLDLFGELVLDPLKNNGEFLQDYVEQEKQNALIQIDQEKKDERDAHKAFWEWAFPGSIQNVSNLGNEKEIKKLDGRILADYHKELMNPAGMKFFVCGGIDEDKLLRYCENTFGSLTPREAIEIDTSFHQGLPDVRTYKKQVRGLSDAALKITYPVSPTTGYEDFINLKILSEIYGGGFTSRLHQILREKNKLTYSVFSRVSSISNLLYVDVGIDASNFERARDIIHTELRKLVDGQFTQQEVEEAKGRAISGIGSGLDSQKGRVGNYKARLYFKSPTIATYLYDISKVSKESMISAAQNIDMEKRLSFMLY